MKNPKLTLKQDAFAMAYMEIGNACEAYRRVYNTERMKQKTIERTAFELFQNPKVTARLSELREEAASRNAITVDWVLSRLKEIVFRAMQVVPVLDRQGEPTGEYTYQGAVANRALELIGRHLGMFADKDIQVAPPLPTSVTIVLPGGKSPVIEWEGHVVGEGRTPAVL